MEYIRGVYFWWGGRGGVYCDAWIDDFYLCSSVVVLLDIVFSVFRGGNDEVSVSEDAG